MKKLVMIALVLLVSVGVASARGYEVSKQAGPYDVQVTIDRDPPVVGDNTVTITVKQGGAAVAGAKVLVNYSMPAMPGMPPMNYKTTAAEKGSEYRADMNLSMAGPWNIEVKITKDGTTGRMKFTVDAK